MKEDFHMLGRSYPLRKEWSNRKECLYHELFQIKQRLLRKHILIAEDETSSKKRRRKEGNKNKSDRQTEEYLFPYLFSFSLSFSLCYIFFVFKIKTAEKSTLSIL